MNWYTARALMRCDVGGNTHSFEEVFVLVYADSEQDALRRRRAGQMNSIIATRERACEVSVSARP